MTSPPLDVDQATLEAGDWVVVVVYFISVITVGLLSSFRNRGSVRGYFLAGRSMHWIPVGASLFASNIGSGHFIGLAGAGASSGLGIAVFELNAIFILMVLGWFFVPVYIASGVFTMPEYLRKRFGGSRIRIYLSVLALMLYVFTKISADLYSGAVFMTEAVPELNLYLAIIILLAIAALFTIGGGLTAVIWTDFIQTFIMIGGAVILMAMAFNEIGGYGNLENRFFTAMPYSTIEAVANESSPYVQYKDCGVPPENSFHLIRSATDGGLPWPGVFFGLTISSIWYWCSDQVIVQRALAAKNLSHAKAGCIFAGYLKFLPMFLIVFPGMIARILYPDKVACGVPKLCQDECGQDNCSNYAYPTLVLDLMPNGMKGLMLAVMMSALISSLTSIFNSSSTLFTMDIWRRIRVDSSDIELMIVGRISVVALVVVGVIWIPVVQSMQELFHYIQAITSFLAPPICAVYCLAVFWRKTNETGAFWGLMVGLLVGMIRFIWEYSYKNVPCGMKSDKPDIISKVHYLHFGIILFVIVFVVTAVISMFTKPDEGVQIKGLTYWDQVTKQEELTARRSSTRRSTKKSQEIVSQPLTGQLEARPSIRPSTKTEQHTPEQHTTEQHTAEHRKSDHPTAEEQPTAQENSAPAADTCIVRIGKWICGIEQMEEGPKLSEHEQKAMEEKLLSIEEDPFWRRALNINALVLMLLAIFMWGYFA